MPKPSKPPGCGSRAWRLGTAHCPASPRGWSVYPINFNGVLKHAARGLGGHVDELAGLYSVGDRAGLDLTESPDDAFAVQEGPLESLRVGLDENTEIFVTGISPGGVEKDSAGT
jgi:hypothetical protein